MLEKRAAEIIMPDLQECGRLREGRKIADMAHTYYVPFVPHCVVSPTRHDGVVTIGRMKGLWADSPLAHPCELTESPLSDADPAAAAQSVTPQ